MFILSLICLLKGDLSFITYAIHTMFHNILLYTKHDYITLTWNNKKIMKSFFFFRNTKLDTYTCDARQHKKCLIFYYIPHKMSCVRFFFFKYFPELPDRYFFIISNQMNSIACFLESYATHIISVFIFI